MSALSLFLKGQASERAGARDEAIAHYLAALKMDPNFDAAEANLEILRDGLRQRALELTNLEKWSEAEEILVSLWSQDPPDVSALFLLGTLKARQGDFVAAAGMMYDVVHHRSDWFEAYRNFLFFASRTLLQNAPHAD